MWWFLKVAFAATLDVPCDAGALVEAFNSANSTIEADTLRLAAGCTYTLTDVAPDSSLGFWMGGSGLPLVTTEVTVDGRGATITRAPTAPPFRLLSVAGSVTVPGVSPAYPSTGRLELRDVTLRGGFARGGNGGSGAANAGGGGAGLGGCLLAQGPIVLDGVTLAGCVARGGDGGTAVGRPFGHAGAGGGGLGGHGGNAYISPPAWASSGGGGFRGGVEDAAVMSGSGGGGAAGRAILGAGGAPSDAGPLGAPWGTGGDGLNGGVGVGGSSNTGDAGDGGFGAGGGSSTDGAGGDGGFGGGGGGGGDDAIPSSGGAGGFGGGGGGGFQPGGSVGGFGGGGGGTDNRGGRAGFGARDGTVRDGGAGAGLGGALFVHGTTAVIRRSTLAGNTASGGATPGAGVHGGLGGAVFVLDGTLELSSVTVVDTTGAPAIGAHGSSASLVARNTLFADALDACGAWEDARLTTGGHNYAVDPGLCAFDGVGDHAPAAVPSLLPLGDYGGLTPTAPASPPSPHQGLGACDEATDQRGVPRSDPCDVGAAEHRVVTLTVSIAGDGDGDVVGGPIDCPDTCTADILLPASVLLHATAVEGEFVGFSGACTGTDDCALDLGGDTDVIARFDVPHAPVAADDAYHVAEDEPLDVAAPGLLANDEDLDPEDVLTVVLIDGPDHGDLTVDPDGGFSYLPDEEFHGDDGFSYRVSDGRFDSDVAVVVIAVASVDDPPRPGDDAFHTPEDVALVVAAPGVLANDGDVEGEALTAEASGAPVGGTLVLGPDGGFTFTPIPGFTGDGGFSYVARDGAGAATAEVRVTVEPQRPVAVDDSYAATPDVPLDVAAADGVLANDVDPNGDALTAELVEPPTAGELTLAADGAFVYTPDEGFVGVDGFTYAIDDGDLRDEADVVLAVGVGPDDTASDPPGCGCGGDSAGGVLLPLVALGWTRRRRREHDAHVGSTDFAPGADPSPSPAWKPRGRRATASPTRDDRRPAWPTRR